VTNSSFDSAPKEAVAIDPEEYWGFTGFAEESGVEGSFAGGGDAIWHGGMVSKDVCR